MIFVTSYTVFILRTVLRFQSHLIIIMKTLAAILGDVDPM